MKLLFNWGAFIFLALFAAGAAAQTRAEKLDEFFQALAGNQDFNGNILIAEKGRIVYQKSFGYADFPGRKLNRKETIFPVASITKTLTATAILQQAEAGKIRLDEPAAKYLPAFPYPEITVRQLLSHTSGLPSYNAFFAPVVEKDPNIILHNADFLAGLSANKQPLIFQPGEGWKYDNINFIVLALLLEKVSGETYAGYIEKHILRPAGMKHTFSFPGIFDPTKNHLENLAVPHWYSQIYADEPVRADSIQYVAGYWKTYQFSGFGDFVSTTGDLLKYDEALYKSKLLGDKLLREAFTPVKLNSGRVNAGNYGLGWTILLDDSLGRTVLHTGNSIGLNCVLYRNLDRHQTVIAFDIAHSSAGYLAAGAMKILNGQAVPPPRQKLVRLYGKLLVTQGKEAAAETLEKLSRNTAHYELDKEDLITLGYEFLGDVNPYHLPVKPNYELAKEAFVQNVRLFPDYWNSYDSYADALARTGETAQAIKMYRKSIELNPQNEGGRKALGRLLGVEE